MEMGGQLHAPAALIPWKAPGTHRIEESVGPSTGLDAASFLDSPGN